MPPPTGQGDWRQQLIAARLARFPNLDPRAVMAVAAQEGLGGGIGDQGTSFGPFQLHYGGAYPSSAPRGAAASQQWAWSPQGIDYALRQIQGVAGGLSGDAAIRGIVTRFERPADPANEIAGAQSDYGARYADYATKLQQNFNDSGDWTKAIDDMGTPTQAVQAPAGPSPGMSLRQLLNASAPTPTGVGLLANLGGIAARAARSAQTEIPLPQTVGQLPSSKGPIDVQIDHNEPASTESLHAVKLAEKFLGTPYLWGGADPRKGFDCSGFAQWVYRQMGVNLPRTTYQQIKVGTPIKDEDQLKPGDLLFFHTEGRKGSPTHEGIYVGDGQFIHAPHTGDVVKFSSLKDQYYQQRFLGARRVTANPNKA